MKVVIASRNDGKIGEIKEIIKLPGIEFLSYQDFCSWPEIRENGNSFRENALLKARAIASYFWLPALADDSGLEVDVLEGKPGILSSRYAGEKASDEENNAKLLRELEGRPLEERTARYRCVAAFADPTGRTLITEGVCEGHIGFGVRGVGGFGYDPLFILSGYEKTMAELSTEEKNKTSHRGQAFRRMKGLLRKKPDIDP